MADCQEVVTRKRLQAILQTALEATTLASALNNVSLTVLITEYPKFWPLSGSFSITIETETLVVTGGHSTTTLTVTRAAPVSHLISTAVTATSSRIYLGVKDLDSNADFFRKLISVGPVVQVRRSVRTGQDFQGHFSYDVTVRFYYGYAKAQDYDWTIIENTNAAGFNALGLRTNYTGSTKENPPEQAVVKEPEENTDDMVGICVKYEVTLMFLGAFN